MGRGNSGWREKTRTGPRSTFCGGFGHKTRPGGRSVNETSVAPTGTWHEGTCVAKRREAHAEDRRWAKVRVGHSLGGAHSGLLSRDGMLRKEKERRIEPDGFSTGFSTGRAKHRRDVWAGPL